jgi:LysW-gamma-L-lysine carboxypeptidase
VISDESALELLVSMLEIPSVSGDEGPHARHLVGRMKEAGFTHAEVDAAGNAVGVMGDGPRQVVLLGHQDTVPGVVPVRREGDLLYGRGAVDAKGPLAAFASAVARVGVREGWQLIVIGAVEEEAATSKGARHVAPLYRPEACVIGEPSSWRALTMGYKGRQIVEYRLRQALSHSAGPEVAPPELGVAFWNRIVARARQLNEGKAKVFEQVSPALLRFDTPPDGAYQRIELDVSVRTPLGFDGDAWERDLREAAGDAALTFLGSEVAYRGDKNNPLVRAFLAAIRAEGGKPGFKVKTGTSDMNVVGPVWECPILAYGPGDSSLDHTPNEHVDVNEYARGVRILARALETLTATG